MIPEFRDNGMICLTCHRRISYNDLNITYELRGDLFREWWCPDCGGNVRTDNMTDLAIVYEIRRDGGR
jgi:hypothetical protein